MRNLKLVVSCWLLTVGVAGAALAADYTGGTVISSGPVSGKYFSGTYEESVYIVEGGGDDVTFENCTFDGVSADANGSCVSIDRGSGSGKVIFRNCRFISCGTEGENYGGAIYIASVDNSSQEIVFENCVALGCKADEGGFLYCNDKDAVIKGSGNTVISGCTAVKGGGVYTWRLNTFDGFILADNTSTKDGGGICNDNGAAGVSTVSNCRFYRNAAGSGYKGGGLFVDDDNGFVNDCRFLENTAGTGSDYCIDDDSTTRTGLLTTSDFANRSFGTGTEADPYVIKDTDDWDALCYKVKSGNKYENAIITLSADITALNSIGYGADSDAATRKFSGTFDGNGKTITLRLISDKWNVAPFKYTDEACIKNLRVNGYVVGGFACRAGGIIGYAKNSRVENCVNDAEIRSKSSNVGGIVSTSYGTIISGCVNNGNVSGGDTVGGIVGWMTSSSRVINALNNGNVSASQLVGGIVGYENSSVVLENCHSPGSVAATSSQYVGGITGYANFASTYEHCFYCNEHCPADSCGKGVSHAALWGDGTETVFELPEAMEEINDYIKTHDKEKDGWLRVALDRNRQPVIVPNGPTDELGYSVGQVSEAEYIFWRLGRLYKVTDGEPVELPYTVVRNDTGSMESGKWYVVEGVVSRTSSVNVGEGEGANLVLLDRASLTVDCGWNSEQTGIGVPSGRALNIFGVASGVLTAQGGEWSAGIGGGYEGAGGTVTIYGGVVTANGGKYAAGIGGGWNGSGGNVTINGGVVTAQGGLAAMEDGRCESIGKGYSGQSSGSLTLGPRVIKFDDNHWGEAVTATFDIPNGLRLVSVSVNVGGIKVTKNGADRRIVQLSKESSLKLIFGVVNDFAVSQEFAAEVTFGPIFEDTVIDASELPKAKMNDRLVVEYALPDGTIASINAYPLYSTDLSMTMGYDAWYVVMDEVTTATIEVLGEANLILADGAKLTVNGGIRVPQGNAFAIYGQRTGSGTLTASGSPSCAGIGGGMNGSGGMVTINGGTVTATGGGVTKEGKLETFAGGAGIGGGGGNININKGSNGGKVTIRGGVVTAIGNGRGAGIGGGGSTNHRQPGAGGEVEITGGTVTAQGNAGAAGIGGGLSDMGVRGDAGTVDLDRTVDVVEGKIGNNSSYVKIAKQTPSCIGGEIAKGAGGIWGVTPEDGATEVAIKYFPKDDFVAVPPTVTKVGGVDDQQIRVRDGNTDVTSQYFIHGGVISPFETFDDGRHYIESSGGAYVDTGYVPTINTRIMADFNSMTGGETAFAISAQESICIFCGYDEDGQCQPQAMQLYSFQIYEGDAQKRDFVPFRTTDGTEIVGLYDRVTQKCFVNAGGGSLTLNGPMCEGGKIAKDKNGVWVVTPDAGVTEVTIGNLLKDDSVAVPPTVTKVNGVEDGQIRVYDGGKDITRNFAIKDGVIKRLFCTVTVGNLSYITAVWTSDMGETNAVVSGSFDVPVGETGVTVIFTQEKGYVLIGEGVVGLGTVTDDITFGSASGYLVPAAGIPYLDWDAKNNRMVKSARAVANCNFVASGTTKLTNGGWYAVKGSVNISSKSLSVSGSAHLILTDGSSLTITGTTKEESALKVPEGSSLTIYGQDAGSGWLSAVGGRYSAGIGGSKNLAGGTVTINGGTVTATGGLGGAGIGGGDTGAGGTVMINGGTVTATGVGGEGNGGGAGIGGGSWGVGGAVTIRGGMVTAIGQDGGKGIGGGRSRNGGSVAIYGGTVRAEGSAAFGETVTLGDKVTAYDVTDGEPGTLIENKDGLTSVEKILTKTLACTDGDIEKVDGVWVVVPNSGVEAVTIENLPTGAAVAVKLNGYTVPSAAFIGFGDQAEGVFSLALNPEGEVNGVKVTPTIGEGVDNPFVAGEGEVAITIKSIAGLKYTLVRGESVEEVCGCEGTPAPKGVVAQEVAKDATVTLEDKGPLPKGQAFYNVSVGK